MKNREELIEEEESKYACCNGYASSDSRGGSVDVYYVHEKDCKKGKQEQREWNHWNRETR